MHNFQLKCKKIKVEQPNVEEHVIENVVKDELTRSFDDITPEGGKILLKDAEILILPEWDIVNAIVFDSVRREGQERFRIEEEVQTTHMGCQIQ